MSISLRVAGASAAAAAIAVGTSGTASASTPGVNYGGNFTQAAAISHLMGANPTDPVIVDRAFARTSTAVTIHITVKHLNSDLASPYWRRFQSMELDLASSGGSWLLASAEAPEGGQNAANWNCMTPGRGAVFAGGVSASPTTNTYVFKVPMSDFTNCGFKKGQRVGVFSRSGMGVDNYPQRRNGSAYRDGSWDSNQDGTWYWFTL